MTDKPDLYLNDDGTFGPAADSAHFEAYKRMCKEHDEEDEAEARIAEENNTTEEFEFNFPIRRRTELELHPNGKVKRYKF